MIEKSVWEQALDWVLQEHENGFDENTRHVFLSWLAIPEHQKAYEEAAHLWLLTGMVPLSEDVADIELPSDKDPS